MTDKSKGIELPEITDEARAKAQGEYNFSKDQLT